MELITKQQLKNLLNNKEIWKVFEDLVNSNELKYLHNAHLWNANLMNADLSQANMKNANLSFSKLQNASLYYAKLGMFRLVFK